MREEGGFVTPSWEALLDCFEAPNGQHLSLSWQESAKISKLKLARNVVRQPKHFSVMFPSQFFAWNTN
jgi:hypothetical protein